MHGAVPRSDASSIRGTGALGDASDVSSSSGIRWTRGRVDAWTRRRLGTTQD